MSLSLGHCMDELSEEVIKKMAAHHGVQEKAALKKRLTDPDHLAVKMKDWGAVEQNLWKSILFEVGARLFSDREWETERSGLTPSQVRLGLIRLRQQGVIYLLRRRWGEPLYWCPPEVRRAACSVYFREDVAVRNPIRECEAVTNEGTLWQDFFHFLVMVDREEIPLTRQGRVHQRVVQKMDKELDLNLAEGRPWRMETDGDATVVHLLIDLGRRFGLVQGKSGRLALCRERLRAWLRLPWKKRLEQLFAWTKASLLASAPEWDALWWLLERHRSRHWSFLQDDVALWSAVTESKSLSSVAETVDERLLIPLAALGWVERGTSRGKRVWRWSVAAPPVFEGAPALSGYVKPDFEVLIPAFYPAEKRWMLAQFADYMGGDQMITYELNAASIRRGKEKGWEGEDMLDCLKEIAGDALPENVAGTLRLWADQYGRVSFREVMLMEVRNERVAEELAGHPDLRDWVLERIGPTSFTVKGEELARLQDWLEEQGYAPRREVGSCVERSRDHPDGESFFGRGEHSSEVAADKGGMLQVEDAYPLPEDAFPGVQSLPRMWLAGMRAYHPATLQEMVRRAIRLQLDLRVEAQGRSSRLFTPRRLENIGGVWMVEGIRPTTATVERMKLTEIRRICVEPPFPSPE